MAVTKHAEKWFRIDSEERMLFRVSIDGYIFDPNRLFEEPRAECSESYSEGRFVILKERRGLSLSEIRLVVIDRKLRNQWLSPWVNWGDFVDVDLIENSIDKRLLVRTWTALKETMNIYASLRFQVVRPHRTLVYPKSFFFLPFSQDWCVPWSDGLGKCPVESSWTQNAVNFDATTLKIWSEPGPSVSEEAWENITQISIERSVKENAQWTEVLVYGKKLHSLGLPCKGGERFVAELGKRYSVPPTQVMTIVDAKASASELLWSNLSPTTDMVQVSEIRPLATEEMRDGLELVTGDRLKWADTLEHLLARGIIRLSNCAGAPKYETTSPVLLGPWVLPRLCTDASNVQSTLWIPERWHVDFLDFDPPLTDKQIESSVRCVSDGKDPLAASQTLDNAVAKPISMTVGKRSGIRTLTIAPSFEIYWENMRQQHPVTARIHISDFRYFEATTSLGRLGNYDTRRFDSAGAIPMPAFLAGFPLVFWQDATNGWQGIGSWVTGHYWCKGELSGLNVHTETFSNDKGGCYDWSTVTLHFAKRGYLSAFFSGRVALPVDEILDWLK